MKRQNHQLNLHIDLDNAAFDDESGGDELARILRNLAEFFAMRGELPRNDSLPIRDINGNLVGHMTVSTRRIHNVCK